MYIKYMSKYTHWNIWRTRLINSILSQVLPRSSRAYLKLYLHFTVAKQHNAVALQCGRNTSFDESARWWSVASTVDALFFFFLTFSPRVIVEYAYNIHQVFRREANPLAVRLAMQIRTMIYLNASQSQSCG